MALRGRLEIQDIKAFMKATKKNIRRAKKAGSITGKAKRSLLKSVRRQKRADLKAVRTRKRTVGKAPKKGKIKGYKEKAHYLASKKNIYKEGV